jgi:hypothetical protein
MVKVIGTEGAASKSTVAATGAVKADFFPDLFQANALKYFIVATPSGTVMF